MLKPSFFTVLSSFFFSPAVDNLALCNLCIASAFPGRKGGRVIYVRRHVSSRRSSSLFARPEAASPCIPFGSAGWSPHALPASCCPASAWLPLRCRTVLKRLAFTGSSARIPFFFVWSFVPAPLKFTCGRSGQGSAGAHGKLSAVPRRVVLSAKVNIAFLHAASGA